MSNGNPASIAISLFKGDDGICRSNQNANNAYFHGATVEIEGLATESVTYIDSAWSQDLTEPLEIGDLVSNQSRWDFTQGAVNPTVAYDPVYGKYLFNNYANGAQYNATKQFTLNTPIPHDTEIFISRLWRGVLKTTDGADYPAGAQYQHKDLRIISNDNIVDTADNSQAQFVVFNYAGNGQYRVEQGEGLVTGMTSGANEGKLVRMNSSKPANTLVGKYCSFGTSSGAVVESNQNNELLLAYEPIPAITTAQSFELNSGLLYSGGGHDLVMNQGFQRAEYVMKTNSEGQGNAQMVKYKRTAAGYQMIMTMPAFSFYNGSLRWTHVKFQDYLGSFVLPVTHYEDHTGDFLILIGSTKRFVLTDNLDLTQATVCVPQKPSNWVGNKARIEKLNTHGITETKNYILAEVDSLNTVLSNREIPVLAFGS